MTPLPFSRCYPTCPGGDNRMSGQIYCVDFSHWHVYPVPDFICAPTITTSDRADPLRDALRIHALRDALRTHHPIMRSETGPFSGCRCGQVRLGQDVIAHVVEHLRAAFAVEPPA